MVKVRCNQETFLKNLVIDNADRTHTHNNSLHCRLDIHIVSAAPDLRQTQF